MAARLAKILLRVAPVLALVLLAPSARADGITFLHTPPSSAEAGQPLRISGNVFGAGDLLRARLYYRVPGGRFSQVELRSESGDLFEATIPGRDVKPPAIEYYVVATDLLGRRDEIFASDANPQSVPVTGGEGEQPEERPREKPRPAEPKVEHKPQQKPSEPAAKPAEPKSELEQELAMYGAEDVVSLATKHEQVVSDAPAIASSLSDDELKQIGARIVPDALDVMPGFSMSRDVAGFYRIGVRGLRSDPEVLVLYDGHPLNSPYDGRALIELPTDNLERVEVIRGPGSALYGTGAFLGAVNLVPKRRDEVAATIAAGSFATLGASATAGHTWGSFGLHGDAAFQTSDGYQAPITSDFNSAPLLQQGLKASDDPAGQTDDHRSLVNAGGEARAELPAGTFAASGRFLQQDRGALLGRYDTVGPGSKLGWTVLLGDLSWRKALGAGSISAKLSFDQQKVDRLFQLSPADQDFAIGGAHSATGLQEETAFTTRTVGGEVSGTIAVHPTNLLDVGLQASQLSLSGFSYKNNYLETNTGVTLRDGLQPPSADNLAADAAVNSRLQLGLYLQDEWRPVAPLGLTLGVRADALQLPTVDANGALSGKRMVTSINPRLGVVVTALPNLNFKLLYGRAFRAPTMQDLSNATPQDDYVGGLESGNPKLVPSTVDTVELGAEHVVTIAEGKLRLRGDLFWNRLTHPILALDSSGNDTPLQNRDPGIDVKGAELELRFEASARANAFLNYTWFRAVDLAALSPEFELITDVPQYRLNVGFQLPVGPYLDFDLLTRLGAERRNSDLSKLAALHHFDIPAYALVTAQLRTETLFNHLELALAGYNVTQTRYADDVPRPDRVPGLLPGPGFAAEFIARFRL